MPEIKALEFKKFPVGEWHKIRILDTPSGFPFTGRWLPEASVPKPAPSQGTRCGCPICATIMDYNNTHPGCEVCLQHTRELAMGYVLNTYTNAEGKEVTEKVWYCYRCLSLLKRQSQAVFDRSGQPF